MVVRKLVMWLNVFGFEVIFRRSVVNNLRICWVCGEESKVIKVVRLDSLALLLGAGCLLFRGICGRVDVVVVTGKAGKSRCSVMFTVCLCLFCCLCFFTLGHSVDEAWCPPPQPTHLSGRCRLGHSLVSWL